MTGTRVLLLRLSAAAAQLLHPIIIRGGCEKRKTQTQHTQANNPSPVTVPPSPRSVALAGPAALPWPWGGEAEPGRRGKEGAGAGQTQGISLLSPARRAAQGLGAAAAGAPRSPLRSRRHRGGAAGLRGSAPGSGQLAGSSLPPLPLLLVLFQPFRRRGSPTRTHAAPRPRFLWSSRNSRRSRGFSHPSWGL